MAIGSWEKARRRKIRQEGKDYEIKDGDLVTFPSLLADNYLLSTNSFPSSVDFQSLTRKNNMISIVGERCKEGFKQPFSSWHSIGCLI